MRRCCALLLTTLMLFRVGGAFAQLPASLKVALWGKETSISALLSALWAYSETNPPQTIVLENADAFLTYLLGTPTEDVMLLDQSMLESTARHVDGSFRYADIESYAELLDITQGSFLSLVCATLDDRLCALPISMSSHLFIWNASAFTRLRIPIPETTDQLLALGQAWAEETMYPLAADATGRIALLITYLQSKYGCSWINEQKHSIGFTTEQVAEGMHYLQSLLDNHVLPPLSTQEMMLAEWQAGRYLGIWAWDDQLNSLKDSLPTGDRMSYTAKLADWGPYSGGFQKASFLLAIRQGSPAAKEGALLLNFLLHSSTGGALLGDSLGIPISKAGYNAALNAKDILDPERIEANNVALSWAMYPVPPGFEAASMAKENGVYEQVLLGLENGFLTHEAAAKALMSAIDVQLTQGVLSAK